MAGAENEQDKLQNLHSYNEYLRYYKDLIAFALPESPATDPQLLLRTVNRTIALLPKARKEWIVHDPEVIYESIDKANLEILNLGLSAANRLDFHSYPGATEVATKLSNYQQKLLQKIALSENSSSS